MNLSAADMLRKLGSGIVPDASGVQATGAAAAGAPGGAAFAELLAKLKDSGTKAGLVQSGLSVTIDEKLGLSLTEEQHLRLSQAVDSAQADGLMNAAITIDGMTLLVDVEGRRVTGLVKAGERPATGIDGIVTAAPAPVPDPTHVEVAAAGKGAGAAPAAGKAAAATVAAVSSESLLSTFSVPSSLLLAKLNSYASPVRPQPVQAGPTETSIT